MNAAEKPEGASTLEPPPPTASAMAVKVAVPSAAPTCVAEPTRPEAKPAWASGTAEATTMVVGMKLMATPLATSTSPGSTETA